MPSVDDLPFKGRTEGRGSLSFSRMVKGGDGLVVVGGCEEGVESGRNFDLRRE
jgi:hypothetical protein